MLVVCLSAPSSSVRAPSSRPHGDTREGFWLAAWWIQSNAHKESFESHRPSQVGALDWADELAMSRGASMFDALRG